MLFFWRSLTNRSFLVRAAALSAAGTGLCFSASSDQEKSIFISLSSPVRDSFLWPWRTMQVNCCSSAFAPVNLSQNDIVLGALPLLFSKSDAIPVPDTTKGTVKDVNDTPVHTCNCFGFHTIANAAAKVGPAVVNLSVAQGFNGMTVGQSLGSGTIIDKDGTILTCAHVVLGLQGLKSLSRGKVGVTLQDGRIFEGIVLNADLHSDIALVKIKSKTPLPTAKLGSSSKLRPGDWVVAMGCPLSLQNTVTAGIVSCVDRKSSDLGLGGMHREYLQTDCAIYEGNSGGPLVNIYGEIIGVNIMKVLGADGLNFAVPIDYVTTIIDHFKRNGRVVRTWLGLKMIDLNDVIVAHLKEKNPSFPNVTKGVLVSTVSPGSPADRAGFHLGDVVVEFGRIPVGSIKEVTDIMGDKVGKPFVAVVKRGNNTTKILTVIPEEANLDT